MDALILMIGVVMSVNVSAELNIIPEEAFVIPGSNLNITCVCANCSAENIIWKYFSQTVTDDVTVLDQSTSQLSLYDLQYSDKSNYKCCLDDDTECTKTLIVYIGTPPGPVNNFHCESRNIKDYWCTWEAGDDTHLRTEYQFYYYKHYYDSKAWMPCPDSATKGENSCYISGHNSISGAQDMKVISSNAMGNHTDKIQFNPDKETVTFPPSDVNAYTISYNSIRVDWDTPNDWNEESYPNYLDYTVRFSASGSSELKEKTTKDEYILILDLKPYTEYNIETKAKCRTCKTWSAWSDVVTTRTNETLPTGYVNISSEYQEDLKASDKRDVTLYWTELPDDQLNGKILYYKLSVTDDLPDGKPTMYVAYTEQFTITDLSRFSRYDVTIEAYNSIGHGPSQRFCCIQDLTTVPTTPTDLQASAASNSSIKLQWSLPDEPNGYLRQYDIRWRVDDVDDHWLFNGTASPESTSYLLKHLKVYTLYDIQIRANNHAYEGQWKDNTQPTRTMEGAPSKPPEPVSVEKVPESPEELSVTWSQLEEKDMNGVIAGFKIFYCLADSKKDICDGDVSIRDEQNGTKSTAFLDKLTYFTTYLVWVAAYTNAGQGPSSERCLATTAQGTPSVPRHISILDITSSNITLTWSPPNEPKGVISHYLITYKEIDDGADIQPGLDVYDLSVVISDLYGDSRYNFQVQACNTEGHCGDVAQINDKTKIGAPGPPILHSNTQPVSSTKMSLSWDPPLQPNGPIKYYVVEYRPTDSEEEWTTNEVTTTSANVTVDCGVGDENVMFDFRVSAVTQSEDGVMLPGEPTSSRQYEMCSQMSDTTLSLLIVLPFCVIIITVLSACFTYQYRKNTIPDPYIINDIRIYSTTWQVSFRILEPEVFDDLQLSQVSNPPLSKAHFQTADGNVKIAGFEDDGSTSYDSSTDSGYPGSGTSMAEDFSPIFLTPENNISSNDKCSLLSGPDFAHVANHNEPIIDLSRFDLFNAIVPYLKVGGKRQYKKFDQAEMGGQINLGLDENHNAAIPLGTISHATDPYSKLSSIPANIIPKQSSNHATLLKVQKQTHTPSSSSVAHTSDPYSKLSNIPANIVSKPSPNLTSLPTPQQTQVETLPSKQSNTISHTSDPYSKLSNIPPNILSKPSSNTAFIQTPQPPQLQTITSNSIAHTSDPYSKLANIPTSILSKPSSNTGFIQTQQPPQLQTLPSSSIAHTSDPYSKLSNIPPNILSKQSSNASFIQPSQPPQSQTLASNSIAHTSDPYSQLSNIPTNVLSRPPSNAKIFPISQPTHAQTIPSNNTSFTTSDSSKLADIPSNVLPKPSTNSNAIIVLTSQPPLTQTLPSNNSNISHLTDPHSKISNIHTNVMSNAKCLPTPQPMHVKALPLNNSAINEAYSKVSITTLRSHGSPTQQASTTKPTLTRPSLDTPESVKNQNGYSKVSEVVSSKTDSTVVRLDISDDYITVPEILSNGMQINSTTRTTNINQETQGNDENLTKTNDTTISPMVNVGKRNGYYTMSEVTSKSAQQNPTTATQNEPGTDESECFIASSGIDIKSQVGYSTMPKVILKSTPVNFTTKADIHSQGTNSPKNIVLPMTSSANAINPTPTAHSSSHNSSLINSSPTMHSSMNHLPANSTLIKPSPESYLSANSHNEIVSPMTHDPPHPTSLSYSPPMNSGYSTMPIITHAADQCYSQSSTLDHTCLSNSIISTTQTSSLQTPVTTTNADKSSNGSSSTPTSQSIPISAITNSKHSFADRSSNSTTSNPFYQSIQTPAITNQPYFDADRSSNGFTPTTNPLRTPVPTITNSNYFNAHQSSNDQTSNRDTPYLPITKSNYYEADKTSDGYTSNSVSQSVPTPTNSHHSNAEQSSNSCTSDQILPYIPIPVPAGLPPLISTACTAHSVYPSGSTPCDISTNTTVLQEPTIITSTTLSSESCPSIPIPVPAGLQHQNSSACTTQFGNTTVPVPSIITSTSPSGESYSPSTIPVPSGLPPLFSSTSQTQSTHNMSINSTIAVPVPPNSTSSTSLSREGCSDLPVPAPPGQPSVISPACPVEFGYTSLDIPMNTITAPVTNALSSVSPSRENYSDFPVPAPPGQSPAISSICTTQSSSTSLDIPNNITVPLNNTSTSALPSGENCSLQSANTSSTNPATINRSCTTSTTISSGKYNHNSPFTAISSSTSNSNYTSYDNNSPRTVTTAALPASSRGNDNYTSFTPDENDRTSASIPLSNNPYTATNSSTTPTTSANTMNNDYTMF